MEAIPKVPYELIFDAIPYKVVFVDLTHTIWFLNKAARQEYYDKRGYRDLVGKSLLDCHNESSREKIMRMVEDLKRHKSEVFLKVNVRNERVYLTPVCDENGELIGYFERFEKNVVYPPGPLK